MNELLTKAIHSLAFAEDDLRDALNKANAVESIIILNLVKKNAKVRIETERFLKAMELNEN